MVRKENRKIDWKHNLSEYWGALRLHKMSLFLLMVSVLVIELTGVMGSFLFKEVVDSATLFSNGSLGLEEFHFILLVVVGIFISSNILHIIGLWFRNLFSSKIEVKMMNYLKMKYFQHIVKLDHGFHSTHKTGSLISRMNRGIASVERISDNILYNFVGTFLQLLIVGFSIAYFDVSAAIVIIGIMLSFILYSFFYQRGQEPLKIDANIAEDDEKAGISDVFANIDSIKYFGKENYISRIFGRLADKTESTNYRHWRSYSWLTAGQVFIISIGTIILLFFPILRFLNGTLTLGEIVFIYTIYRNLMGPMWGLIEGMQGFHRAVIDFQDLFHYGKIESKIKDVAGAKKLNIKQGDIEFRDVDFGYGKRKIFRDFNLHIPAESKVAFVGHSGCGKSTLVNLLYRFYDVEKGAVLIDGEDVRDFKQEGLREAMSIVPQECVLFDDSIWNNIKFSNPKASRDEVWKAIKFAQLDGIICDMAEKEKTIVGERGVKLSGGEKQRVSIARAILANKKILVLDEATSALDSETEFEIQKDLARLMKGRTSIIIAHRLSTIMHADLIVVMKKGKIVEMGTHAALLRKKGEYKRLWGLQKGGYIK